jgi:hypothetical protein
MLSDINALINSLRVVENRLFEVSSSPDSAMISIRRQVASMVSDAETLRSNLYNIQARAQSMTEAHNVALRK